MTTGTTGNLVKLSDTDLTIADPALDVRGREVVDSTGEKIGEVSDLLIDDDQNQVRFLQVASGGFVGIGEQHFLVPVDAITDTDEERVHTDRERARMQDIPIYDPQLAYDPAYYSDVYGWWGYAPYWGTGATSPRRAP